MRNILGSVLIVLVGSIFSLFLFFTLVPQPIYDYLVAKTIPVYPNLSYSLVEKTTSNTQTKLNTWTIEANTAFPDGLAHASIDFTTEDHPKKVIEYYIDALQKQGWVIGSNSFKESQIKDPLPNYYEVFTKVINNRMFEMSISGSKGTKFVFINVNIQSIPLKR